MISFCGEKANDSEKKSFVELVKKEILYSKQLEEIILNSRYSNRERYFLLQKELRLEKLDDARM